MPEQLDYRSPEPRRGTTLLQWFVILIVTLLTLVVFLLAGEND